MKQQETLSVFMGQYEAQLSRRGGFRLPEIFRQKLLAEDEGNRMLFFLRLEEALCIFSAKGLRERVREASATQRPAVTRYLVAQSCEVKIPRGLIDSVVIPPRVLEVSGLVPGDKLALLGAMDHIEVWSAQVWDAETRALARDENILRALEELVP